MKYRALLLPCSVILNEVKNLCRRVCRSFAAAQDDRALRRDREGKTQL
jgi:hypothetical protein